MNDLIAFLRARLDEDAELAELASPGPWRPNAEGDEVLAADDEVVCDGFALSSKQLRNTVRHIARWDPVCVRDEVEAKRRIIAHIQSQLDRSVAPWGLEDAMMPVLAHSAAPYAAHPDYNESWSL